MKTLKDLRGFKRESIRNHVYQAERQIKGNAIGRVWKEMKGSGQRKVKKHLK